MKKAFVTIGMMVGLAVSLFLYDQTLPTPTAGSVTIVLSEAGDPLQETMHAFTESDTLFSVLDAHYDIACADREFQPTTSCEPLSFSGVEGRILLEIGPLKSDWFTSYIALNVNGEHAAYGIDQLSLEPGDTIELDLVPTS